LKVLTTCARRSACSCIDAGALLFAGIGDVGHDAGDVLDAAHDVAHGGAGAAIPSAASICIFASLFIPAWNKVLFGVSSSA
jgi:hypothetical protein